MPITLSYRIVALVAGAAIAVGVGVLAPQPGAGTHPPKAAARRGATSAAAQAATVRYWTTARMTAALRTAKPPATPEPRAAPERPAAPERSVTPERRLIKRLVTRAVPEQSAQSEPHLSGPWSTGNTRGIGLRVTHDDAVADAVGKVFFTLNGDDYVCSGTLVGGKQADVVLTAAHCVSGGAKRGGATDWATNWMFVPGFRDGEMPYGEYPARRFFVSPDWTGPGGGTEQYDVAFVQVTADPLDVASPPPGLPVAFAHAQDAVPASQAYVFGYPALTPYTGQYPDYCAGPVAGSGGSLRMACGMTAGDSGGPWLTGFSPQAGQGTVVAVSTYKLSDDPRALYGATLGPQARALYAEAVSPAR